MPKPAKPVPIQTLTSMLEKMAWDSALAYKVPRKDVSVFEIKPGYGYHIHGKDECNPHEMKTYFGGKCIRDCDDSDLIVTLQYVCADKQCGIHSEHVHHATFGIKGDEYSLWAD